MTAYEKTVWKDNQEPAIDEVKLNKIEDGIYTAHDELDTHMDDDAVHVNDVFTQILTDSVSHMDDDSIHITGTNLQILEDSTSHIENTSIHLTQEDIDAIAESVSHIIDANIHLSVNERAGLSAAQYPANAGNSILTCKELKLVQLGQLLYGWGNGNFAQTNSTAGHCANGLHGILRAHYVGVPQWTSLEEIFDIPLDTTKDPYHEGSGCILYTGADNRWHKLTAPTGMREYYLTISGNSINFPGEIPHWKLRPNTVSPDTEQTISGLKKFTTSPTVPTPTTDYQASTKKYVDTKVDLNNSGVQQIAGQKQFMLEVLIPDTPTHVNAAVPLTWANNNYVKTSGDENVSGIKTFSASPVVPEPTTDYHASTKKYVDDHAAIILSVNSKTGVVVLTQDDIGDGVTNKIFSATEQSKLSGIENSATADMSASEIKSAYESNEDTNVFDDAASSKLGGIEAGADVTDATNVAAAGAVMTSANQTITDIKTFSTSPIVPTPTTNYQVATKKYVDDHAVIGGVSSVNTYLGAVVLTQDDISDGTTNKQFSATEQSKLSGIETAADVTDATNVAAAGAVMVSGTQTINNVKTFTSFPVLPEADPTSNYEAATKKYVDDHSGEGMVSSVNSKTGAVVLTQDDIGDGVTNKVFTVTHESTLANAVQNSGDSTINGIKTFGSIPVLPEATPTTDYQVASKKYVDDTIPVDSVNSKTGVVVLTQDDIGDGVTNKVFSATEQSKLSGIETGATADQTASEIKSAYESNADTHALTDVLLSKLNGIEAGATADQTAIEIKSAYESNADTHALTDVLLSKLNGIEAAADVTDATNVAGAGAVMNSGDSTINGIKTFGSIPVLPEAAPTTNYQAANKKYVDDTAVGIAQHNNLNSIDGGTTGEYYHLTADEHTRVLSAIDYIDTLGLDDIIGIEWDSSNSSPTLRRIDVNGDTITTTQSTFDNHPIWGNMKRCVVDYTTGGITYGTNNRGDGLTKADLFVEIPRFYVKFEKVGALYRWWVSPVDAPEFEVHPAFRQYGRALAPRQCIYPCAYEAGITTNGDDTLHIASGTNPITGVIYEYSDAILTITQADVISQRLSNKLRVQNIWTLSAIKLLFFTEYATFNSRSVLGRGIVDGGWQANTFTGRLCGADLADTNIGINGTGTGNGTDGWTPIVYRGIENLWGNCAEFVNGLYAEQTTYIMSILNPGGSASYVPDALDTITVGVGAPSDGHVTTIMPNKYGALAFLPTDVGGSNITYVCSWYHYPRYPKASLVASGACHEGALPNINFMSLYVNKERNDTNTGFRPEYIGDRVVLLDEE